MRKSLRKIKELRKETCSNSYCGILTDNFYTIRGIFFCRDCYEKRGYAKQWKDRAPVLYKSESSTARVIRRGRNIEDVSS